jgi:catechol 2,3-dioxygenase-like lactoylglutathione lyase family enzyme
MADVKPIPEDYPQLMPYLCVHGANAAIDFYRTVFGAVERMRMPEPDGRLGHAEVEIGSAVIMLSDEFPALGIRAPNTIWRHTGHPEPVRRGRRQSLCPSHRRRRHRRAPGHGSVLRRSQRPV